MASITSEQTQAMAISAVEGFLNNKVPLSVGLAKQASAYELNSDQIQRAVEATNSIAYLKILQLSDDRTIEFPLCKYAEVMAGIAVPESHSIVKSASVSDSKAGKVEENFVPTQLNLAEQKVEFIKQASLNKIQLDKLKDREVTIVPELLKAASIIKSDIHGLEKLATVCNGEVFNMASSLVYGEAKPFSDTGLFKSAELVQAEKFVGLLKEAKQLTEDIKHRTELHERSELTKQAILGSLGSAIGRTIGTVAGAPIKVLAKATQRAASNVGGGIGNAAKEVYNKVAPTFGLKSKTITPVIKKKFGLGAGLITASTVAADSSFYTPGRDATTGRSKDIWTSLQREPN